MFERITKVLAVVGMGMLCLAGTSHAADITYDSDTSLTLLHLVDTDSASILSGVTVEADNTVTDGSSNTINVAGILDTDSAGLSETTDSYASMTVSGSGAQLLAGTVFAGAGGEASLNLNSGASATVSNSLIAGFYNQSKGHVTVTGSDTSLNAGNIILGDYGFGDMIISDQGRVIGGVTIGKSSYTYEDTSISGSGALIMNNGRLWAGGENDNLVVGGAGSGRLSATNSNISGYDTISVGAEDTGIGNMFVIGGSAGADNLNVGEEGTGNLTIQNSGSVNARYVGISTCGSGKGKIVVEDSSSLNATFAMYVGGSQTNTTDDTTTGGTGGNLTVANSGVVKAGALYMEQEDSVIHFDLNYLDAFNGYVGVDVASKLQFMGNLVLSLCDESAVPTADTFSFNLFDFNEDNISGTFSNIDYSELASLGYSLDSSMLYTDGIVTFNMSASEPQAIPEPGMVALLGIGLAGLALKRRYKRT